MQHGRILDRKHCSHYAGMPCHTICTIIRLQPQKFSFVLCQQQAQVRLLCKSLKLSAVCVSSFCLTVLFLSSVKHCEFSITLSLVLASYWHFLHTNICGGSCEYQSIYNYFLMFLMILMFVIQTSKQKILE